jgi:O-antigen/teichoic acid export membrane protein
LAQEKTVIQPLRRTSTDVENKPIWQRFRRNTSISLIGSGLSLAIKLGQTALLTKLLKIDDYGRLLIVLNLFVFLDSFFGLRVSDVMFRFFLPLREERDHRALKGLLVVCLGISLASGVLIYGGVLILSPSLADRLYPNLSLAPLFAIYGCTLLVTTFSGVYEPILRVYDRFASIVVSQILGSLITFALLCVCFASDFAKGSPTGGGYNLRFVVGAFALGALTQSVPPLVQALWLASPFLRGTKTIEAVQALSRYRRNLVGCFVNSNLSGYLKFAISPGDVFLLGIFSSPAQLALYGLAKQLTAPLALLLNNIQTAITPEITSLAAKRRFEQLKRLVVRYVRWMLAMGSLFLVSALLLGRLLILRLIQPEYANALPVFYVLLIAVWLMLALLAFRPLAVSLDLLKWHNLALLASAVVVTIFITTGHLNAMTMACLQLAEVLVMRSLVCRLVWTRLDRLASFAGKSEK